MNPNAETVAKVNDELIYQNVFVKDGVKILSFVFGFMTICLYNVNEY